MASGTIFALSMRSSNGLCLLCRIRRTPTGIYFLVPRSDPGHNVHASYHVDGMHHVKSYGRRMFPTQRQRLDGNFHGAEQLFAYAIPPGDEYLHTIPCRPERFNGVFALGPEHFASGADHTLTVDLVEANGTAILGPWQQQIWQESIRDAVPWILITLWRGLR